MNVDIIKDAAGNAVRATKNPEISYIQVRQERLVVTNGWFKKKNLSAIILGDTEEMVEAGFNNMLSMPGKIIIKEQTFPFNEKEPERDLKRAGMDGPVCRYYDEPIYSKNFYTANLDEPDVLIKHTNSEEIKRWNQMSKEEKEATGSGFFTAPAVPAPPVAASIPPPPPTESSTESSDVPPPPSSFEKDEFMEFDFDDDL